MTNNTKKNNPSWSKFTLYPRAEMKERIDKEYLEYLKTIQDDNMVKPISKSSYLLVLIQNALDEMEKILKGRG